MVEICGFPFGYGKGRSWRGDPKSVNFFSFEFVVNAKVLSQYFTTFRRHCYVVSFPKDDLSIQHNQNQIPRDLFIFGRKEKATSRFIWKFKESIIAREILKEQSWKNKSI